MEANQKISDGLAGRWTKEVDEGGGSRWKQMVDRDSFSRWTEEVDRAIKWWPGGGKQEIERRYQQVEKTEVDGRRSIHLKENNREKR